MRYTSFLLIALLSAGLSAAQPVKSDSAEIRTAITSFYNWYNTNWKHIQAFKFYYSTKKKDSPPYKINWKEVERYFAYIRKSVPYLGEEFINQQRTFFTKCDEMFKEYP